MPKSDYKYAAATFLISGEYSTSTWLTNAKHAEADEPAKAKKIYAHLVTMMGLHVDAVELIDGEYIDIAVGNITGVARHIRHYPDLLENLGAAAQRLAPYMSAEEMRVFNAELDYTPKS